MVLRVGNFSSLGLICKMSEIVVLTLGNLDED